MRRLAAGLALLLPLTACGLPLAGGVQEPGSVPAEQRPGGDIQVLPPGPRDDAPAEEIVRDFFGAQSDPSDAHASAREFLAPELAGRWRDTGPVSVFGPALEVASVGGAQDSFRVTGQLVGRIGADGSYRPEQSRIDVPVKLRRGPRGRWLITAVPDGLLLSSADRDRSFRPRNVYFLAPSADPASQPSHLVPDRLFLPVTADAADALVRHLLAGPSRELGRSAQSAFPRGTTVRSVRTDPSGLVTVDLSAQVGSAGAVQREQMSAQLVWTLRSSGAAFSQLRLRSAGRDVSIGGSGASSVVQDRADWPQYDPDGLSRQAPLYYVGGRRLRVLDPVPTGPSTDPGARAVVDLAAASTRGRNLALLTLTRPARWELRTGPTGGPFVLRFRGVALSSPTWGSGDQGVWFLSGGAVMLAPPSGPVLSVPVDGIDRYGPISQIRVSRDGARIGLVAGSRGRGRLLVGRVQLVGTSVRVVELRDVAPRLSDVRALSWSSATSLVALARDSGDVAPLRVSTVAMDGSSVALINRLGLEQSNPLSVAAAPDRPLVVGVAGSMLFRDTGGLLTNVEGVVGSAPFYPG